MVGRRSLNTAAQGGVASFSGISATGLPTLPALVNRLDAAISRDVDDCDDSNNETFGHGNVGCGFLEGGPPDVCDVQSAFLANSDTVLLVSTYWRSVSPFWYAVSIEEGALSCVFYSLR